jgi:MoxR-like ATPase
MEKTYKFRDDSENSAPQPADAHKDCPKTREPYVARKELVEAVNLAIYLRRPLLLEGEAGCGKTRLARAVAFQLGLPYYPWPVRSTSKVQEGLYTYDALLRLHDVQVASREQTPREANQAVAQTAAHATTRPAVRRRDPSQPKDYRRFGALGKAFRMRDRPAVVLIDEVDKADLDFPNDLLTLLDRDGAFPVPETSESIKPSAGFRPIVFITSNKEKGSLPAPFLRRCVYFFVEFPGEPDKLKRIIAEHYRGKEDGPTDKLVDASISRFLEVRARGELYKKPGTSELIDWIEALRGFGGRSYPHDVLAKSETPLPYPELLFKLRADWQNYRKAT